MAPDTTSRILEALPAPPGITVAELATQLELADSTIRKTLTELAAQGHAQRLPGTGAGRRRTPDRWAATAPTSPDDQPAAEPANQPEAEAPASPPASHAEPDEDTQPTSPDTSPASDVTDPADRPPSTADTVLTPSDTRGAQEDPGAAVDSSGPPEEPGSVVSPRLGRGQLRDLVHQFLIDHALKEPGGLGPAAIGKHLGRSQGAVANALDKLVNQGLVYQVQEKPRRFAAVQHPPTPPLPAPAPNPKAAQDPAAASMQPAPASAANGQANVSLAATTIPAAPDQPSNKPVAARAAANGTDATAAD